MRMGRPQEWLLGTKKHTRCSGMAPHHTSLTWQTFGELMHPVISAVHGGFAPNQKHPTDLDFRNLIEAKFGPDGKFVQNVTFTTVRSVKGFRLPAAIEFEERREVEALVAKGLDALGGELGGTYYSLGGSRSQPARPQLPSKLAAKLQADGWAVAAPRSLLPVVAGVLRCWPDARGVFESRSGHVTVAVNVDEHVVITSNGGAADFAQVFRRMAETCECIRSIAVRLGKEFMRNDHLGFISGSPQNLGTCLEIRVEGTFPSLSRRNDFIEICDTLGLAAECSGGRFVLRSAVGKLGVSETFVANTVLHGVSQLVILEQQLDSGGSIEDLVVGMRRWGC
mmetsp:Transcript_32620/g.73083  ORF Transcript_32620/g.73083 Transcript_32620/m.73083 type:complete len:338 (-) Transcript_32620:12-1025(-)